LVSHGSVQVPAMPSTAPLQVCPNPQSALARHLQFHTPADPAWQVSTDPQVDVHVEAVQTPAEHVPLSHWVPEVHAQVPPG
jgi:hypothetical protein